LFAVVPETLVYFVLKPEQPSTYLTQLQGT